MTAFLIAGGIAAALVILGAYLRRAAAPVAASFRLGMAMGRQVQAQNADSPDPGTLPDRVGGAVLAWLMPWRAARVIREQREDIRVLVGTLAFAVTGATGPLKATRPDFRGWYHRPGAVLMTWLMPWRAVRKLRRGDNSVLYLCDALLAHNRKHHAEERQEAGELASASN